MKRLHGGDGGDLFSPPYDGPVRINLLTKMERAEALDVLRAARDADDDEALLRVLSVAVFNLKRHQARQACDLILRLLSQPESEAA